jgi:hypothetical protein
VAVISPCALGSKEELLVCGGTIAWKDSPLILTHDGICWQHGPIHVVALNGPVHHSVMLGLVRPPSRNSTGKHAAVFVKEVLARQPSA